MLEGGSGFEQCRSSLDGEPPALGEPAALFPWRYTCTQGCIERLHETGYEILRVLIMDNTFENNIQCTTQQGYMHLANCTICIVHYYILIWRALHKVTGHLVQVT